VLAATEQELEHVRDYLNSQAPALVVSFLQKVYSESVAQVRHDIWDVHTEGGRWWVITRPTNLYSQDDFPNMDLALTFHVGLCIRVPRSEKQSLSSLPAEPFVQCFRGLEEAAEALSHADEVADFQAVGVRCREALLAFVTVVQPMLPAPPDPAPKKADLKSWVTYFCEIALRGESEKARRQLLKSMIESAWDFSNWLTHSKSSTWFDAESAVAATESSIQLFVSAAIRYDRGVPKICPTCGSHRLSPERGYHSDEPELLWERPTCDKCGWKGTAVQIVPNDNPDTPSSPPDEDCLLPTSALKALKRPMRRAVK
jgi:hypothetical protein